MMTIAAVRSKFQQSWLHLKSLWKLFTFQVQIKKKKFEEQKSVLILQFLHSTVFSSKLHTQSNAVLSY